MPLNLEEPAHRLSLPLPRFRQPLTDPDLPAVTADPDPTTTAEPSPEPGQPSIRPSRPSTDPPSPTVPRVAALAPTPTSSAGDPKIAAQVVAGLLALACGIAYGLFARRGRHFRQPSTRQITDIADPVGAILARHLPTEFISKDLVDATAAAGATHAYLVDGPLVTRIAEPMPDLDPEATS